MGEGQRNRARERLPSGCHMVSAEPDAQFELTNCDVMTGAAAGPKPLSHPGAPRPPAKIFTFMKKGKKQKLHSALVWPPEGPIRRQRAPRQPVAPPSAFPRNHIQHLRVKPPEVSTVCEHVYFLSIYFVPLLARCVPRYQKNPLVNLFKLSNGQIVVKEWR